MARLSPVLPLVGAETRFQPVYVDDVAAAAEAAATGEVEPGVYELGGPEVASFRELMRRMLAIIRRRRLIVALPLPLARLVGRRGATSSSRLTRGLVAGPLTADQVRQLSRDNVVAPGARGLAELGVGADADAGGARELSLRLPAGRPVYRDPGIGAADADLSLGRPVASRSRRCSACSRG